MRRIGIEECILDQSYRTSYIHNKRKFSGDNFNVPETCPKYEIFQKELRKLDEIEREQRKHLSKLRVLIADL